MENMKKIITLGFCCLMSIASVIFTSCDTDVEGVIYTPETTEYSFASTQQITQLTKDDQGVVKVPVYRNSSEDDSSIELEIQMNEATGRIFSLTTPVISFKKGENVTYAELNFGSIDKLGAVDKYNIQLSIEEKSISSSGIGTITVQASRLLTWENYGTGVYTSELFGESWEQPIEKAAEGNIFRLPDCIFEGYPFIFTLSDDGQELIGWDIQATGYNHSTYGMVYFLPAAMYRTDNTLFFPMQGLVIYNGGYARLYSGFTESLQLP
ncbi:MAG: hypothetical protein NC131_22275 [Roseburia sp.]|nr:hypothetical protein [Roseburia sp.]